MDTGVGLQSIVSRFYFSGGTDKNELYKLVGNEDKVKAKQLYREHLKQLSICSFNVEFYNRETYKVIGKSLSKLPVDVVCIQEDVNMNVSKPDLVIPGFTRVASCEGQNDDGRIMGNPIYIRSFIKFSDAHGFKLEFCDTPRCATSVTVRGVKIINTHLCGGRYDDPGFKRLKNAKVKEMSRIVKEKPDIIVGDFNGDPNLASLSTYPLYTQLSKSNKHIFDAYYANVHKALVNGGYVPAYTSELGATSMYGGTVDWMYHTTKVNPMESYTVSSMSTSSDHIPVVTVFEIS